MSDQFLKPSEIRKMLGVSRTTIWRWTVERGLKVVKVGDVVRIRESDLEAFLKRHETAGGTTIESSQTQVTKSG